MFQSILAQPSYVEIQTENGWKAAARSGDTFATDACQVQFRHAGDAMDILAEETLQPVLRIRVRWCCDFSSIQRVLGDAPGVAFGDLAWMPVVPEKYWAWYLQCFDGKRTHCYGVKTGCNSFCFWQLDQEGISLTLDIRNGGSGVMLRAPLLCATVVQREGTDAETPFRACQAFCRQMCEAPNLPKRPVFGLNNWYYAYGNISRESVLADTALAAELCANTKHRPYMLIDDGWQLLRGNGYIGGPFVPSEKFGDMETLAGEMSEMGCEPGLWIRPLLTKEEFPQRCYHPRGLGVAGGKFLDPSKEEVLEYVSKLVSGVVKNGYKIIKYDFTAPDMMTANIYDEIYLKEKLTDGGWQFDDNSLTNAQIIKNLYSTIQQAAGDSLVMGCNTYNHLAAGIHQIQRSGLDTGGPGWNTTRKMGVNPLAFRLPQNGNFFITDPDCAAIIRDRNEEMNLRFFEACALSGTSLFLSATPGVLDEKQKQRVADAFRIADKGCTMEPMDWFDTTCPRDYLVNGQVHHFNWYDITQGVNLL